MPKPSLRSRYARSAVERALKNVRVQMVFEEEEDALGICKADLVRALGSVLERQEYALVNMALSRLKMHVEPVGGEAADG